MEPKRATPRSGNYGGVRLSTLVRDSLSLTDYERGCLYVGLSTALMFGLCLMHWAGVA